MRHVPVQSPTYDSGKRKGESRFIAFALASLATADYPHLPATKINTKDGPKEVPELSVAASDVLAAQADSVSEIVALYPSQEAGESALVDAWNDAVRVATTKEAKRRFSAIKAFTGDVAAVLNGLADSVVRSFTNPAAKIKSTEKVKIVTGFAANLATMSDEEALAQLRALRAQLGISA